MTTIKEHLVEVRKTLIAASRMLSLEHKGVLGGKVWGRSALDHLSAIEAALDRPMKSAEEWRRLFNLQADCYGDYDDAEMRGFIEAIQQDVIASKSPEVDLRALAEDTTLEILVTGEENTQDIIHAALLKAKGER